MAGSENMLYVHPASAVVATSNKQHPVAVIWCPNTKCETSPSCRWPLNSATSSSGCTERRRPLCIRTHTIGRACRHDSSLRLFFFRPKQNTSNTRHTHALLFFFSIYIDHPPPVTSRHNKGCSNFTVTPTAGKVDYWITAWSLRHGSCDAPPTRHQPQKASIALSQGCEFEFSSTRFFFSPTNYCKAHDTTPSIRIRSL